MIDSATFDGGTMHGCNQVPFDPSIAAAPTSKLAEAPSGLSFNLSMPNSGLLNKDAIAEGQPKKVEVTLPEGMTVNPSAAEGLAVCAPLTTRGSSSNSKPGEGCPDASKIGNVEIQTPLISETVKGALYQAAPYDNPSNSLLGLYIVARVPERGVLVKLDGKVSPDPQTGQLVTTFDDAPQLPFSSFDLSFREGGRAPLVTPPACGDYDVVAKFTPWSAKDPDNPAANEVVTRKSTFTVQRGVDGGACPLGRRASLQSRLRSRLAQQRRQVLLPLLHAPDASRRRAEHDPLLLGPASGRARQAGRDRANAPTPRSRPRSQRPAPKSWRARAARPTLRSAAYRPAPESARSSPTSAALFTSAAPTKALR